MSSTTHTKFLTMGPGRFAEEVLIDVKSKFWISHKQPIFSVNGLLSVTHESIPSVWNCKYNVVNT